MLTVIKVIGQGHAVKRMVRFQAGGQRTGSVHDGQDQVKVGTQKSIINRRNQGLAVLEVLFWH